MMGIQGWDGNPGIQGLQGFTGSGYLPTAYDAFFEEIQKNEPLKERLQKAHFDFTVWNNNLIYEIGKLPTEVLPLLIGIHYEIDAKITDCLKFQKGGADG